MKKPIIAIDVDDVLAHSVEAFRLRVNAKAGVELTPEHYRIAGRYHHYLDSVLEANGVDYSAIKDELFQLMAEDQSHIRPQQGAVKALKQLKKHFDLMVITARAPEWEAQTHIWLERHFPGVFTGVHFAGNRKDPARKTKGDMCLEVGAVYLIDDNPEHTLDASEKGIKVVLFGDYGWHVDVPKEMVHCKTWQKVEVYFTKGRLE